MTPHPIHILDAEGNVLRTINSSGSIRLKATTVDTGRMINGIRITTTEFGQPEGLPEFQEGTFYIVSQLVKSALSERADLLVPAEVLRDTNGNILGCQSLGI